MSTEVSSAVPGAGSAPTDPGSGPSPTVTRYQTLASEIRVAVKVAIARIPDLEAAHPSTVTFVRKHQNFSLEFIATAVAAVESSTDLQGVNSLDVAQTRDTLQFIDAFRPFIDELMSIATNLKFTMDSRRAKATLDALQIYAMAKAVARNPSSTLAASHVENLQRDIRRQHARKQVNPQQPPTTQPPATPAVQQPTHTAPATS